MTTSVVISMLKDVSKLSRQATDAHRAKSVPVVAGEEDELIAARDDAINALWDLITTVIWRQQ